MLGLPLLVAACVYCKCTNCKCCRRATITDKKSGKISKPAHSAKAISAAPTRIASDIESGVEIKKGGPLAQLRNSSDEDDSYHIPGQRHIPKKVMRPMAEFPKSGRVEKSIHIPKKVNKPMCKFPKSPDSGTGSGHSSETASQASSTSSVHQKLLGFAQSVTKIPLSILKKRPADSRSQVDATTASSKKLELLVARPDSEGLYSFVEKIPLQKSGAVELGVEEMDFIDAEGDDPSCCRERELKMKRGFRQIFSQEKTGNRSGDEEAEKEQRQGFFQKFFRPSSSRSSGGEGTSAELERRPLLHDDDGYAIIDRRQLSVPVSPKSVTFEDELFTTERRGQSVAPRTAFSFSPTATARTTPTKQTKFTSSHYDALQSLEFDSWHDTKRYARSAYSDRDHFSPSGSSRDASRLALDEATFDLLRLSSQPPSVWYSSSSRLQPAADRIPKSASTTSMNKVIRTQDGGVLKLSNAFSWDTARLGDQARARGTSPIDSSKAYIDRDGRRHETVTIYTDERRKGPPIIRTTVEGNLKMEKIVGADLISVDQCMCSAWTIRDTVTHYKVKTTLGNRTLIMEERSAMNGENRDTDFKMSIYEDGRLKTEQSADIRIPSNRDKADYLSQLSQRLLREVEKLEQRDEQRKTITRIEVEVIEDVTKILKTYIIGERNDLLQEQILDQAAVDATDEFTTGRYRYESTSAADAPTPSYELSEKEYVDVLEKELEIRRPPSDIRLFSEGQRYEERSEIRTRKSVESETTTTSESITAQRHVAPPRCAHVFAECHLKRTEDHSLNEVNVAMPNVFSAVLSLIYERVVRQLPHLASYGIEQHGKAYTSETTIQRVQRFESTESEEVVATTTTTAEIRKEPSFLFEKPQVIEPVKIPELNITELDIRRMADTSAISANFAIPRIGQSQLDIERRRYEVQEAQGGTYGLQQRGQHYKDEAVIKKARRFVSESEESVSEERTMEIMREKVAVHRAEERVEQPESASYEMRAHGQEFKGESRLQRGPRRVISSESTEEEEPRGGPTYIDLIRNEARGEFEVVIVISNDQRGSPKWFEEKKEEEEAVNFVAQVSTEGKKEEVLATVAARSTLQEVYRGREVGEETSTVSVAIQKIVRSEDVLQQSSRNWNDTTLERMGMRCRESREIQAVIMYSLQSEIRRIAEVVSMQTAKHQQKLQHFTSAAEEEFAHTTVVLTSSVVASQEASCIRGTPNLLPSVQFSCRTFGTEDTTAVIYMQNKRTTALLLSSEHTRKTPRKSDGHMLRTAATTTEIVNVEVRMERDTKYGNYLQADVSVTQKIAQDALLRSRESREVDFTSNVALSQGAKTLAASAKLIERIKQGKQMRLAEYGDETEHVAVMLQRGGTTRDQTLHEWPVAITGRSSTKTTATTCSNPSSTNSTTTHFSLSTDLTTGTSTTSKHLHLANFKTLLPAHSTAQHIIPIVVSNNTAVASANLRTDRSIREQQIPSQTGEQREEIQLKVINEFHKADTEPAQECEPFPGHDYHPQDHGPYFDEQDDIGREFEEEISQTYRIARETYAHDTSILMQLRNSTLRTTAGAETEALYSSTHAEDRRIQIQPNLESTREVPIRRMPVASEEPREVPIDRAPSGGTTPRGDRYNDSPQTRTAEMGASLRSIETSSLFSLGSIDSGAPTERPYRSTEFMNESRRTEVSEEHIGLHLQATSVAEGQWESSVRQPDGSKDALPGRATGHHERVQETERRHTQEIFYFSPHEKVDQAAGYHENLTESSEKQETEGVSQQEYEHSEELRGKLQSEVSEARVAMLRAGFDLDTTLLATPDAAPRSTFAKDHSMTTSEYFSDECCWSTITESYRKRRRTRVEHISQSVGDLREAVLGEVSRNLNIVTDSQIQKAETAAMSEKIRIEEADAKVMRESFSTPDILETCKRDTSLRSAQYEASTVEYSTGTKRVEEVVCQMKKPEEMIQKAKETFEEEEQRRNLFSSWETVERDARVQITLAEYEQQQKALDTKVSKIESIETTKQLTADTEQFASSFAAVVSSATATEVSRVTDAQETVASVDEVVSSSSRQEISGESEEITLKAAALDVVFSKIKKPLEEASSEHVLPLKRTLQTNLDTASATFEETEQQLGLEFCALQYDAVTQFPLKPVETYAHLQTFAVARQDTSKEREIQKEREVQVQTVPVPSLETKVVEKREVALKVCEETEQQHNLTHFEMVEREANAAGTFRESEFLEEMKQLKAASEEALSTEQVLRGYEAEGVAGITQKIPQKAQNERSWAISREELRPEFAKFAEYPEASAESTISTHREISLAHSFVEHKSTETQIGGQFYRISQKTAKEGASSTFPLSRELYAGAELAASSTEDSELVLELTRTRPAESVLTQSLVPNYEQIALKVDAVREANVTATAELNREFDMTQSADAYVKGMNLGLAKVDVTEITEEDQNIMTQYSTTVREAVIDRIIEEKNLVTAEMALQEAHIETLDVSDKLTRAEVQSATGTVLRIQEAQFRAKNFEVSEKHEEKELYKLEEEGKSSAVINCRIEETVAARATEFGDEVTSVSGLFEQIGIQEASHQSSKAVAQKFAYQLALDTQFASTENTSHEIALETRLEAQKVSRTVPEEIFTQAQMDLRSFPETSIRHETTFGKYRTDYLELEECIASTVTEKASAAFLQTEQETQGLVAQMNKVLREAATEKSLSEAIVEKKQLFTVAAMKNEIENIQNIRKEEECAVVEQYQKVHETASSKKHLAISSEVGKQALEKQSAAEICVAVMPDIEVIEVHKQLVEFGMEQLTTSGSFLKLEQKEAKEQAQIQISTSVKLEKSLASHYASSESVVIQENIANKRGMHLAAVRSVEEKSLAESTSNLEAAREELAEVSLTEFELQAEHVCSECGFTAQMHEATSSKFHEFGDEMQELTAQWNTVKNEMSSEMLFTIGNVVREIRNVNATTEESLELTKQLEYCELTESTDRTLPVKPCVSEIRGWTIVQDEVEGTFQRSEQQVGKQSVFGLGHSESETGHFYEYGVVDAKTTGHFARITVKKAEKEEAVFLSCVGRKWEERLDLEASKESTETVRESLSKSEQTSLVECTLCESIQEGAILLSAATSENSATREDAFEQQKEYQACEATLKAKNVDLVCAKYTEQREVARSLDATWRTVVDELGTMISIRDAHQTSAVLSAAASQDVSWETETALCMQQSHENALAQLRTVTALSGGVRQFRIEHETRENELKRQEQEMHAEGIHKAEVCGESIAHSLIESSEVHSDAGILLMRRTAEKTAETATHVVNIALTLEQELKTEHAREASQETSVTLVVQAPSLEIGGIRGTVNREAVSLETESSKEAALQETVGVTKSRESEAGAERVLQGTRKEAIVEKMKEADSKAFEILSQWTTVYRDLETEASFYRSSNIASVFSAFATSEEEAGISESWAAQECIADAALCRAAVVLGHCQREFQIEYDELKVHMEKYEKEEKCCKIWKDKNSEACRGMMRECSMKKLNALINLHRVSKALQKQKANECVWQEKQLVSAEPLYIKCDAAESDRIVADIALKRAVAQMSQETLRTATNWGEPQSLESEQAGDEKVKLSAEIRGVQPLAYLAIEAIWPEAKIYDAIIRAEVEEYAVDRTALFAQLTGTKGVPFAECMISVSIGRSFEPQTFLTQASKEELAETFPGFEATQEAELTTYVVIIGNKEESVPVRLQETVENFVSLGLHCCEEPEVSSATSSFAQKRFGGDYQLATKAAQTEDRFSTATVTRSAESKAAQTHLRRKLKEVVSRRFSASHLETSSSDICLKQAHQAKAASTQRYCPRAAEPVGRNVLETAEAVHITYAQFKVKESSASKSIVRELPNTAGHFTLCTDSAEESALLREVALRKTESTAVISLIIKQAQSTTNPVLLSWHATEESAEISKAWVVPDSVGKVELIRRYPNRGSSVVAKLTETSDIKQSSYLQFSQESEYAAVGKIVREPRFGGKLYLFTEASEECELRAVREIISSSLRIAHCMIRIASGNWSRGTRYETIASSSESADILAVLKHPACLGDSVSGTVSEKALLRSVLTIRESEATTLTTNLSYTKKFGKEFSECTIRLARSGGSVLLLTAATKEEQKLVKWILEKRRDTLLGTTKCIIVMVLEKVPPLITKQSESVDLSTYSVMERSADQFEVRKIIIAANRGDNMSWSLLETVELNEFLNYQFQQIDEAEHVQKILRQALYGGHLNLQTMASEEYSVEVVLKLASQLETDAAAYFFTRISNRGTPTALIASSSVLEESNQVEMLQRKFEVENTSVVKRTACLASARFAAAEFSFETETINLQYKRDERSKEEVGKILYLPHFGGQQKLSTEAAGEVLADAYVEFTSKRITFASAHMQKEIPNSAAELLSTMTCILEESNQEFLLQKTRISESETLSKISTANSTSCLYSASESTNEVEWITAQWRHPESSADAHFCIIEASFGGALVFSTSFAKESEITFTASLSASRSSFASSTYLRQIAHKTVTPVFSTTHSTQLFMETVCSLVRQADNSWSEIIVHTANRGLDTSLRLTESTEISSTTNIRYEEEQARAVVLAVLPEARFGGSLILSTLFAKESEISFVASLSSSRATFESTKFTRLIARTIENPTLTTAHTTELLTGITCSLSRATASDRFEITVLIGNWIQPIAIQLTESTDVSETVNIMYEQKPADDAFSEVFPEARFGGALTLSTESAKETEVVFAISIAASRSSFESTTFTRFIARTIEKPTLSTACATEFLEEVTCGLNRIFASDRCEIIARAKNWIQPILVKLTESTYTSETMNIMYERKRESETSSGVFPEARFGGALAVSTRFAKESEVAFTVSLAASRSFLESTTFIRQMARTIEKPLLSTEYAMELLTEVECFLTGRSATDRSEISVRTANWGQPALVQLVESAEVTETINIQYGRPKTSDASSKVLPEARFGGALTLTTEFARESEVIFTISITASRSLFESTTLTRFIARTIEKPTLNTRHATEVLEEVFCGLNRISASERCEIIAHTGNWIQPALVTLTESTELSETLKITCERRQQSATSSGVFPEARFGGALTLSTSFAKESVVFFTVSLAASRSFLESTTFTRRIARTIEKPLLSTEHATELSTKVEYLLTGRPVIDRSDISMRTANLGQPVLVQLTESTEVFETTNIHYDRAEPFGAFSEVFPEARFGGSLRLSTSYAQESEISYMASLSASKDFFHHVTFARQIPRTTETPFLITACSTELFAEIACILNRLVASDRAEAVMRTTNQGQAVHLRVAESTAVFETINIRYERQQASTETAKVLPEARFGGLLILNSSASVEEFLSQLFALRPTQRLEQYTVEIINAEKNCAYERYQSLAAHEETATSSAQLQKASDIFTTTILKRATRRGDQIYVTVMESSEIAEFNNFMLKKPVETAARHEFTLREARFGGSLELSTRRTTESTMTVSSALQRSSHSFDITVRRVIANRGESVRVTCSATEENHFFVSLELQSMKLARYESLLICKAPNRETPQQMYTSESSELVQVSNVSMQKTFAYESSHIVWAEKRRFEILPLLCNASRETYAELYNCLESRLPLKQHAGTTIIFREIRRGDHVRMKLMATEETIFNAEVSFEKQSYEAVRTHTEQEISTEVPQLLETLESLETAIEVRETEVRRRLSEVHVESALEIAARECSPISLQTDSAEQTLIRHDAELHVDVQRTVGMAEIEKSAIAVEREKLLCAGVDVTLRHEEEEYEEQREEKSEKRVSFAEIVTEKTVSMDMSMTVERRAPSIIKKPMKKEQRGRRSVLRQNEAPNFVPVRRNSLLLAMNLGSAHNIPHYKTLEDVIRGIKKAGLEYSNLIFGIDYTKSNKYQGERTFDGRNLHSISSKELNPYQQVIEIVGKTLSSFDADGVIPAYGFGDEESTDQRVFNLYDKNDLLAECNGFEEVLKIYNEKTPYIGMSGPTNFVPLIEQAVAIVREKQSYHILVIVADGQVTNEKINQKAIAAASHYPLSIIMVGVGDGPWNMMTRFDETLPKRMFDNFHFVDFHKVMFNVPNQEASFALNALMEIPDQYKAIKELGLLKHSRRG